MDPQEHVDPQEVVPPQEYETPSVRKSSRASVIVCLVLGLAALGLETFAVRASGAPPAASAAPAPCVAQGPGLRVAASPAIAGAVAEIAQQTLTLPVRECFRVSVESVAPDVELAALAAGAVMPDVWVPDSSLWLDRAGVVRLSTVTKATSVASSPLVLAVAGDVAKGLRHNGTRPEVEDLVPTSRWGRTVTLTLPTERLSPARVGGILALTSSTGGAEARAALTDLARGARPGSATGADPVAALASADPMAVPVSERDVWAANGAGHVSAPVAIYAGGSTFDFPYAVLADDAVSVQRAGLVLALVSGEAGQHTIRATGLRDAAGVAGPGLASDPHVDGARVIGAAPLSPASLDQADGALKRAPLDARLLGVIDVSGSMGWGVRGPGSPGPSRLTIAGQAAARGLGLYPDSTEVGLWVFSQKMGGGADHREVVPIAQLGGAGGTRAQLAAAVKKIAASPAGGTALYATTSAAVQKMQTDWDSARINAVVLLSDGMDTNTGGPTLPELVSVLTAQRQSARPVPVITIAFGPESDDAALAAISAASGGTAYHADRAEQVQQIFLDAVGQRACRPNCLK